MKIIALYQLYGHQTESNGKHYVFHFETSAQQEGIRTIDNESVTTKIIGPRGIYSHIVPHVEGEDMTSTCRKTVNTRNLDEDLAKYRHFVAHRATSWEELTKSSEVMPFRNGCLRLPSVQASKILAGV
jgi:hypothetical protein